MEMTHFLLKRHKKFFKIYEILVLIFFFLDIILFYFINSRKQFIHISNISKKKELVKHLLSFSFNLSNEGFLTFGIIYVFLLFILTYIFKIQHNNISFGFTIIELLAKQMIESIAIYSIMLNLNRMMIQHAILGFYLLWIIPIIMCISFFVEAFIYEYSYAKNDNKINSDSHKMFTNNKYLRNKLDNIEKQNNNLIVLVNSHSDLLHERYWNRHKLFEHPKLYKLFCSLCEIRDSFSK